jgi:hypothetical protein
MKQILAAIIVLITLASAHPAAQAPMTLDEMILAAPAIVVATVESRRAEYEYYGSSRLIITKVTLRIEDTLKGSAPRTLVVEVLGGTLDDQTLHVSHVPEFQVGDRDVLFLSLAPHSVSPLVGSDQGRFRILTDNESGTPRVLTMGYEPVASLAQIGAGQTRVARRMSEGMSLPQFVTAVRDRARTLAGQR